MFILKKGHQPGVYVPLRALFLVFLILIRLMYLTTGLGRDCRRGSNTPVTDCAVQVSKGSDPKPPAPEVSGGHQ